MINNLKIMGLFKKRRKLKIISPLNIKLEVKDTFLFSFLRIVLIAETQSLL